MKDYYTRTITILIILITIMLISACAPESEIKPPETSIEQMQSVYGQSGIRMVLSGVDDKTPAEKLTYHYAFYTIPQNKADNEEEVLFFEGDSETGELFIDAQRFQE